MNCDYLVRRSPPAAPALARRERTKDGLIAACRQAGGSGPTRWQNNKIRLYSEPYFDLLLKTLFRISFALSACLLPTLASRTDTRLFNCASVRPTLNATLK